MTTPTKLAILENLYNEELYHVPSPVLIIISQQWEELSDDDIALLSKILNSVKLTLASVKIITANEFSAEDFSAFQPKQIIAFGSRLNTPSGMYEPIIINDISLIQADALNALNDATKKSLWLALRKMFGV